MLNFAHFLQTARWRIQYATDLVREDVTDFSRVHEIHQVRLLLDMRRCRAAKGLVYFATRHPRILAEQWVRHLRHEQLDGSVRILSAARALASLAA